MLIEPVDHYHDLFAITDVVDHDLVQAILQTDWLSLSWSPQPGQESWARRKIDESQLPWIDQWHQTCERLWPVISDHLGLTLRNYQGTAWWLDEPGFTCSLHTDGEMPGAMQIGWIGAHAALGTCFYHYKNSTSVRHHFLLQTNTGYIMINRANDQGYRHLQWHGMLTAVPKDTFRLSSYSWMTASAV